MPRSRNFLPLAGFAGTTSCILGEGVRARPETVLEAFDRFTGAAR